MQNHQIFAGAWKYIIRACILPGIIFLHATVNAQQFVFNRVPLFEENVRGFITAMAQDSKGYMWFTGTSLYRYDGYRVVTYKNEPNNANSLSSIRLEFIFIDSEDILWLGTFGGGLDKFDPSRGIFTHYVHNAADPSSISNNIVTSIIQDNEGYLWAGTHGGLNRLDKKTGKFIRFNKIANDSTSLSNDQVRALYLDKKGIIWAGCGSPYNNETPEGEGGLNRLDKNTGKFTRYLHKANDTTSLFDNKVRAIYEDSKGNFWIGTFGDGLHLMDRSKGTFRHFTYDPAKPEKLSSPQIKGNYHGVSFITEDKAGGIWIGAFLAGLNRWDTKTNTLNRFKAEPDDAKSLGENTVWYAAFSREGVLWITTQSNVYRVDPLRKTVAHTATGGRVHAFLEDASGVLWMASDSGLIRKDRKTNAIQYFVNNPKDEGSINSNLVLSVYEDKGGQFWVGTDHGLNRLNRQTNTFTRYQHDQKNRNTISDGGVLSMLEDRQGTLWIGTDGGLDVSDRRTGFFKHYRHSPDSASLSSNAVYKLLQDKAGNLWIGTWSGGGLNLFDKNSNRFKHYLQGNNVVDLYEDAKGTIWAGTQFGLFKKDSNSVDFTVFTDASSEISTANIVGITEDAAKNLWIGSQSAIIKLNADRDETAVYGRKYGIIPNSTYDLPAYKTRDGKLFFGDGTGYFEFYTYELTSGAKAPQLQITDFKIGDISLKPGQAPLTSSIEQMTRMVLNHKQGNFSLDFAAMHYSSSEENRHLYMLEGYDDKWRKAGAEKSVAYFNVPPGNYVFKIKACSSDGVWTEKTVAITILPPWWRTWWAYALYALVMTGIIWGIVYYRSKSLMSEKKMLEHQVKLRTSEILRQKEEIAEQRDTVKQALLELKATQDQLVQRENMASLGDLTAGIAHEIKNPMNFVNNFAEITADLLKEMNDQLDKGNISEVKTLTNDVTQNLERIIRHGKTADSIIQGMLQHSGTSTGKKEPTDINAFTDEYLRLCYNRLRTKDKSFQAVLKTDYEAGLEKVNIIPGDVGRVLLNIIGNAFYAIEEKTKNIADGEVYEPVVTISTNETIFKNEADGENLFEDNYNSGKAVEIHIKDNGIGILPKLINRIFQPFFTTKPAGQGTGLGLWLSYDIIVKGHGGEINVQSTPGVGSEFIIVLPVKQVQINPEQIIH